MKFNAVCSYLPIEIANMKLDMKIPRNTDLKVPVRYLFDYATCTSEYLPKEIISHLLVHKLLICYVPLRKFTLVGSLICP